MRTSHAKPWFPVKRFGYGVGLPMAWQGWLVLAAYLAVAISAGILLSPILSVLVLLVATGILLAIAYVRSDGEWRWRDGERE